jgi:Transglutaminase-like superfamily
MTWWKLSIRKCSTILRLSGNERSLLIRAMYLLPVVAIVLQIKGLRFTQDLLLRLLPPAPSLTEPTESEIWATVRMVRIAVRYNRLWTNCLKQSLVLWILLRHQGAIADLKIGIERESKQFAAHAWVEYQDTILNDTDDVHQRFQAFDRTFDRSVEDKL